MWVAYDVAYVGVLSEPTLKTFSLCVALKFFFLDCTDRRSLWGPNLPFYAIPDFFRSVNFYPAECVKWGGGLRFKGCVTIKHPNEDDFESSVPLKSFEALWAISILFLPLKWAPFRKLWIGGRRGAGGRRNTKLSLKSLAKRSLSVTRITILMKPLLRGESREGNLNTPTFRGLEGVHGVKSVWISLTIPKKNPTFFLECLESSYDFSGAF